MEATSLPRGVRMGLTKTTIAAVLACSAGAGVFFLGLRQVNRGGSAPAAPSPAFSAPPASLPPAVYGCALCHPLPPPYLLPRDQWPRVMREMNERIAFFRLGTPLTDAELNDVIRYYSAAAPERLPRLAADYPPSPISFSAVPFGDPPAMDDPSRAPVICSLRITDLDRDSRPDVLVCDASRNALSWIVPTPAGWHEGMLASLPAPARAEPADLNGDGVHELLVACLGTLTPTDDPVGSVVILAQDASGTVHGSILLSNVPRASDVRAFDADSDGDLDLVVALFGLYRTGGVTLLTQTAPFRFDPQPIMLINGTSHCPVGDLDGDGMHDIVILISQEHEKIVALRNLGRATFEPVTLWQGPHPAFGLAGLELVDLDGDGDLDVLVANGDALDFDVTPKPWHGVQWLENRRHLTFVYHDIMRFHGAYRATACDLDGDGDLDIVVTSMGNHWDDPAAQSLIWLENDGSQRFTPHPISASPTYLVTAEVADLTGDGRPDIIAGGMYVLRPYFRVGRITLWQQAATGR